MKRTKTFRDDQLFKIHEFLDKHEWHAICIRDVKKLGLPLRFEHVLLKTMGGKKHRNKTFMLCPQCWSVKAAYSAWW